MQKEFENKEQVVIVPREKAVFWMDGRGRWHNQHGPFQHKKIIEYFNSAIKKDAHGYFVGQFHNNIYEKVYFPYEETALFVIDVVLENPARMKLNTGEQLNFNPELLFVRNDHLFYAKGEDEIVKFAERALRIIAERLDCAHGGYTFDLAGVTYQLPECP